MNKKRHDIKNNDGNIDTAKLMSYLNDEDISETERHEIEKMMLDDPFIADAAEGLDNSVSKDKINAYVQELNNKLRKSIATRKKIQEKRKLPKQYFTIIATIIILLLLIITYIVIKHIG